MSEMAIARVHPAFGDVRFGELSHQLEGGLWPPGVQDDGWTLVFFFPFPMLPHLRPTDASLFSTLSVETTLGNKLLLLMICATLL